MNSVTSTLLAIAAVVVIVCGCAYMDEHVTCFNLFGITKGCVTR